jgi:inner membrane protein
MAAAFWSLWWVWMAGALALAIVEMILPGFVFLGFALGALAVGLILLIAGPGFSLAALLFVFAGLSLAAWLGLRHLFAMPKGQVKRFDHDIND